MVVVVGRDPERLVAAEPVLAAWTKAQPAGGGVAEGRAEAARAAKAEFTEIQAGVARRSGRAGGLRRHQRRAGTDARAVGRSGHSGRGGAGAHERADVALDEGAGMIRVLAGAAAAAAVWAWVAVRGASRRPDRRPDRDALAVPLAAIRV